MNLNHNIVNHVYIILISNLLAQITHRHDQLNNKYYMFVSYIDHLIIVARSGWLSVTTSAATQEWI